MRHYNGNFSAGCVRRSSLLRHAPAPNQHSSPLLPLLLAKCAYTAIPLNKLFTRRGTPLHLSSTADAPASLCAGGSVSSSHTALAAAPHGNSQNPPCAESTAEAQHAPQRQPYHFLQCRTTSRAPALVYTTAARSAAATASRPTRTASTSATTTTSTMAALADGAGALRVREALRPATRLACVRVPRLLVFGGDVVSVTALEALHARMRCIVREALRCSRRHSHASRKAQPAEAATAATMEEEKEEDAAVDAFVREHITVVCPALPKGMTPEEAAKKFTRQYPVARYCVDHGLPIIPVDHPKSLTRSSLLKDMLSTVATAAGPAANASAKVKKAEEGCAAAAAAAAVATDPTRGYRKTAAVSSHLPSHVFSAAQLVRNEAASQRASTKKTDEERKTLKTSTAKTGKAAEEGQEKPQVHTWAAQGRPLADYDLAVVVSFRYFLPQHLLRVLPPVINMHPSLLPRYRGASPIFSALRHNEAVGGVSIIQMKPEQKAMDSGSILWQCEVPITPDMDIRLYFPLVTQIGAAGLCDLIFGEAPAAKRTAAAAAAADAFASMHSSTTVAAAAAVAAAGAATTAFASHHWSSSSSSVHGGGGRDGKSAGATAYATEDVLISCTKSFSNERVVASHLRFDHNDPSTVHDSVTAAATASAQSNDESKSIPPWVALRRSSLMPVVHRAAHHTSLTSPLHDRERLAPYVDRPELSIFSSIITAHTRTSATSAVGETSSSCSSETGVGAVAVEAANGTGTSTSVEVSNGSCSSSSNGGAARQCRHWMTLCRSSTLITPEAVSEASKVHRALFFQNLESMSAAGGTGPNGGGKRRGTPHNKKQVSPAAAAELEISTAMKCAEVFPKSVLSSHCDWPDSFTYSWKFAQLQEYRTFAHFTDDPFHAPLLAKDAAVLRFSAFTAMEAFGVWRAFVGGDYFQPSMNATLDKGSSPVRNQLVHRGVRRLLRERAKGQHKGKKSQPQQHTNGQGSEVGKEKSLASDAAAAAAAVGVVVAASDDGATPVGIVVGKHVELDVFNPAGLQLLAEAENLLRTPCTFTLVTNPSLVPPCVVAELAEVERGGDRCCGCRPAMPLSGRRVRFYRAPPPIFRSLLNTARPSAASELDDAASAEEEGEEREMQRKAALSNRKKKLRFGCCGGWPSAKSSDAAAPQGAKGSSQGGKTAPKKQQRGDAKGAKHQQQPDEPAEDEEAPDDYVPDVIHAAPPTEHRWHIPPGTGYFPESDESYGAIKCKEGWFLWKEAHMKWSNKAQPAVLIRKGLAMKTGVLYVGLFSEYS